MCSSLTTYMCATPNHIHVCIPPAPYTCVHAPHHHIHVSMPLLLPPQRRHVGLYQISQITLYWKAMCNYLNYTLLKQTWIESFEQLQSKKATHAESEAQGSHSPRQLSHLSLNMSMMNFIAFQRLAMAYTIVLSVFSPVLRAKLKTCIVLAIALPLSYNFTTLCEIQTWTSNSSVLLGLLTNSSPWGPDVEIIFRPPSDSFALSAQDSSTHSSWVMASALKFQVSCDSEK